MATARRIGTAANSVKRWRPKPACRSNESEYGSPLKKGLELLPAHRQLEPDPDELACARDELAELQDQARQGQIILLYEDETLVWRFALPRAGWWRKDQRYRLPLHSLSRHQSNHQERLKRQVWKAHRSWSRIREGVLLSVIGAVQYGTAKVIWKATPHFDTCEFRCLLS